MSDPLDIFAERLAGVQRNGAGWMAYCPSHGDGTKRGKRSLSIKERNDGAVMLHCFAGCPTESIVAELGLEMHDLFASPNSHHRKRNAGPSQVWEIKDASGRTVARHHRKEAGPDDKRMWWTRPDGAKGLGGMPVAELPLYRSQHVSDWSEDEPVVVTEGEKAADALAKIHEAVVGTVTGASGTPGDESLSVLKGRDVVLWPDNDNDGAGRKHMQRIGERLAGIARRVRVLSWPDAGEKDDAADFIAGGGTTEGLERLADEAPEWTPSATSPPEVGTLLDTVEPEKISWLWSGRIPIGKVTLIEGDPGLGKSAMTTDLAARVSVGRRWPDGSGCGPGGVVIMSAEDGISDTIVPRLEAAGAALSKVLALSTVPDGDTERLLSIPEDIAIIRRGIERVEAKLVILDPLTAFLSDDVNSHRDQDVRRALAPLGKLAEDTGAAILVIRHLNKSPGGSPLYRGGGSIGIIGAARSALLVAPDPEDESRRVLASLKSNLAPPAPSLAFSIVGAANDSARVEWKGSSPMNAATLLSVPADDEERRELAELRDAVVSLLEDAGGFWEGPPQELYDALEASETDLPDRPDEMVKRLGKIIRTSGRFRMKRTRKRDGSRVIRVLRLNLCEHPGPKPSDGVNSVHGVHGVHTSNNTNKDSSDSVNTMNTVDTVNGDEGFRNAVHTSVSLTEEDVLGEFEFPRSGPARALETYLEEPSSARLEYLTKAIMHARHMDTTQWSRHKHIVKQAAARRI